MNPGAFSWMIDPLIKPVDTSIAPVIRFFKRSFPFENAERLRKFDGENFPLSMGTGLFAVIAGDAAMTMIRAGSPS